MIGIIIVTLITILFTLQMVKTSDTAMILLAYGKITMCMVGIGGFIIAIA